MKKLMIILIFVVGCSGQKNVRFAVATPAMFKDCIERCGAANQGLDKVFLNLDYGTNSHNQSWCAIHVQCNCQTDTKGKNSRSKLVITPEDWYINEVGGGGPFPSGYDACEKLWNE